MMLQSAYAIIDLSFIGRLGPSAVAGLSISLQAFFLILALAQIIGITAMAKISQLVGAGKRTEARTAFSSYLFVTVITGVCTGILALAIAPQYVSFFTDDPAVLEQGLTYFRINTATFLTQTLLIVLGSGFRANGDFVTPMKLMVGAVLFNLVLDPLLIFGLGPFPELGIAGAAIATVAAQVLGLWGYWHWLHRPQTADTLTLTRPQIDNAFLINLARKGLPVGIQFFLLPVYLGIILYAMKDHGPIWTATAGGGFRVLQQTLLPLVALGQAAAALAGQNFGAGLTTRVKKTAQTATVWGMGYGLIFSVLLLVGGRLVGHIFADTEAGLDAAQIYYLWSAPTVFGFALAIIPAMVLQALGKPSLPMIAAIGRILLLILIVIIIVPALNLGPQWVFGAGTITTIFEGLVGSGLLLATLRKLPIQHSQEPLAER